ncbi:MCE family protein [Parasulfuritortus cantonensis]|uniref:MCE family protein n=1 Tax=Parasulfuritortus cantonensis TaxID=2528202 RepID=A0A4R1BD71_9PROT|nr:MlaD family protein [Parasulfuritortus cantonensis]TCJ15045.1 MCE family protein [Parasulfuritortus cantonensis]
MERAPVRAPLIKNLEFKVGLLLVLTLLLAVTFLVYALYVRGAFERTNRLTLVTENAEGVEAGMTMTYAGFPVGRVKRMDLTETGQVRIEMAIPVKDAKWLRETSVFTLEKSIVGGAKIRAFSTDLKAPLLPNGAERPLYTGDAAKDLPEIMAEVKSILANVNAITKADSSLSQSLAHVKTVTERMAGQYGVLGGMLGEPENAAKVVQTIDHANTLVTSLNGVSQKADGILGKTDQRMFGKDGVMDEAQKAVVQINGILGDVRDSLKKADAILANGQAISANVKDATVDMAGLRAEVDDSLAKVNGLINEINRKWPFARDVEVKLP